MEAASQPELCRYLSEENESMSTEPAGMEQNLEASRVHREIRPQKSAQITQAMPDMYGRLRLLQQYQHVAIVGFSADPFRPSYFVAVYLLAEGYDVVLVNPRYAGQTVLGRHVYASLTEAHEAGEKIQIVDVFRKPTDLEPILVEAIQIGAQVLWLQLGIRNDDIGRQALAAGLTFVQDRCVKMEHARFFGGLHTIGLNTGVILARKLT
jgi:predicted CoA-binding protein